MRPFVLALTEIDPAWIGLVGGKGASLAALARIEGVSVPDAFCVTTAAAQEALASAPGLGALIDQVAALNPEDHEALRAKSAELRRAILGAPMPEEIAQEVRRAAAALGAGPTAVRSSATAEDLPGASFAGQHDSFLNVVGPQAILEHVRRCWASLFTERAVAYRARRGLDARGAQMAVVVQRMVPAEASGVLFTADPVTGHRGICAIEAVSGLGEPLVSGLVTPRRARVRAGQILPDEPRQGPEAPPCPSPLQAPQLLALEALGRHVEARLGAPQDIEWCLAGGRFHVVQSRPLTTLYPVPDPGDSGFHVYISVGHQQMMTDAMRPLGLSLFQLTAARPMLEAGGRLFVDPTAQLSAPASRAALLGLIGRSEPLILDALNTLVARGDLGEATPQGPVAPPAPGGAALGPAPDPSVLPVLIARSEASLAELRARVAGVSGVEAIDLVLEDVADLRRGLADPEGFAALMAGMNASAWLNEHMAAWLGEKNAADLLSLSAPNNVTSEMGLALLDLADVFRPHPEVLAHLAQADEAGFWEGFAALAGGPECRDALAAWLHRYGMRCVGEIDVTRPRWSERPTTLAPLILSHVRTFEPGAARRRVAQGLGRAEEAAGSLLARLRQLPDGEEKAAATEVAITRLRAFTGYREHPKYTIICRFFVYKQVLMAEANRLYQDGVISEPEEVHFLTLPELRELIRTRRPDEGLIRRRREQYAHHQRLTPPRVLTSDGEIVTGSYRRDVPQGALVGLAVSQGVVEGRARVLADLAGARLEPGDILVTAFTDPSWTPCFVTIAGLVTEVGGLLTHGAVIARELGLPAVVGVEGATARIPDGARIRVNGAEGLVEILAPRA